MARRVTKQEPVALDLGYLNARPVVTRTWRAVRITLVGCGGTGSWLAPSIARIARVLLDAGEAERRVLVAFVDPDQVEEKNLARQNFCAAEVGSNKARALALRYGAAWGLDILAVPSAYSGQGVVPRYGQELGVVVGCVDNADARRSIAVALEGAYPSGDTGAAPGTWWLDCGNARESGQVLLGCSPTVRDLSARAFATPTICAALPVPTLQRPELLKPQPDELPGAAEKLSCAELAALSAQSLSVNQAVAAVAADYLLRLLVTGGPRRFATYLDLASGSQKSLYTTEEAVAASVGKGPEIFRKEKSAA